MTAGIPHEMRRTAWASLAAHVVILLCLFLIPLMKMPPMGSPAMQVMLVSNVTAPILPVERPPDATPLEDAPALMAQPAPVRHETVVLSKPVRLAEKTSIQKIPVRKTPVAVPAAPAAKSVAAQPVSVASLPVPLVTNEINKLLSRLPSALPQSQAPIVARPSQGAVAPRFVTMERCPPQAYAYCPLVEAAINRVWSADTDPGIRLVLESAGDATATMRMVILPNGAITGIQVSASSGNEAYDRAVQSLLRGLRHLPPLPAAIQGESFVVLSNFTYNRARE